MPLIHQSASPFQGHSPPLLCRLLPSPPLNDFLNLLPLHPLEPLHQSPLLNLPFFQIERLLSFLYHLPLFLPMLPQNTLPLLLQLLCLLFGLHTHQSSLQCLPCSRIFRLAEAGFQFRDLAFAVRIQEGVVFLDLLIVEGPVQGFEAWIPDLALGDGDYASLARDGFFGGDFGRGVL